MTKYAAYNLLDRSWHVKVKTSAGKWIEVYKSGSRRRAFAELRGI